MRTPAKYIAALALMFSACGDDETCGFRDHAYNATFVVISGPCRQEQPRILSFALPPPNCTQDITYLDCDPTVSRACGLTNALWALRFTDTGYTGQLQETHRDVSPPVVCRYATELTEL